MTLFLDLNKINKIKKNYFNKINKIFFANFTKLMASSELQQGTGIGWHMIAMCRPAQSDRCWQMLAKY